jgi:hypothetical protein
MPFAREFRDIPTALAQEDELRIRMIVLIALRPIHAKSVEGRGRVDVLREVLRDLAAGRLSLGQAATTLRMRAPEQSSPHAGNNRVFTRNWAERLVADQFSRFYNQAVLEHLRAVGVEQCVVSHAADEDPVGVCATSIAGRSHLVKDLHSALVAAYELNKWDGGVLRVPSHPA